MRTDLAKEALVGAGEIQGISVENEVQGEVEIQRVTVLTPEAAERLDKPVGHYVTLTAPENALSDARCRAHLARCAAVELASLSQGLAGTVMAAGLGNRHVTPDALGPLTVEHVFVTRHILRKLPDLLPKDTTSVAAFAPGVMGVTGMETYETVMGQVEAIKPCAIIAIDSLAASEVAHIGRVVQLNDSGIAPGAGVGNFQNALNKDSVGVPVFAIGVPLVVTGEAIARGVLGDTALTEQQSKALGELTVTPKDIDALVTDAAKVLSQTLNLALHGERYGELEKLLTP